MVFTVLVNENSCVKIIVSRCTDYAVQVFLLILLRRKNMVSDRLISVAEAYEHVTAGIGMLV